MQRDGLAHLPAAQPLQRGPDQGAGALLAHGPQLRRRGRERGIGLEEGVGVALVDPLCLDATLRERIDVRPLRPEIALKVQAVYSISEPLSHPAKVFLEVLRNVLGWSDEQIEAARAAGAFG